MLKQAYRRSTDTHAVIPEFAEGKYPGSPKGPRQARGSVLWLEQFFLRKKTRQSTLPRTFLQSSSGNKKTIVRAPERAY